MVFFQGMLLAGYTYSHVMSARLGVRSQSVIHIMLLLMTALLLPIGLSSNSIHTLPSGSNPVYWLLKCLLITMGLPFFIVSTNGPLLQKWFSRTSHHRAKDPYFLYGASNLGSLLALLGYPLLMEPALRLQQQSWLWTLVYALLVVLIFSCAVVLWKSHTPSVKFTRTTDEVEPEGIPEIVTRAAPISLEQRLWWVCLAFIPSSLMLGLTAYLSTDISPMPLLWVIPLSIYLLTFTLVFAKTPLLPKRLLARFALPITAVILTLAVVMRATQPTWALIPLNLLFFFVAAMVCHGRLANERPVPEHLTEFYLWMSIGGVLGGLFNALVAPSIFNTVVEYPLMIVLACLVRPSERAKEEERTLHRQLDFGLPLGVGLLTAGLGLLLPRAGIIPENIHPLFVIGLPLILTYAFVERPTRFALSLGAIMIGGSFYAGTGGSTLHVGRNFFGVSRVALNPAGTTHQLYHGNTLHGQQFIDPARQCEPLTYYHRSGPLGQVFESLNARPALTNVAVIGLGAGTAISYATPNQNWTFYEIDPAVVSIARNPKYFTYLQNCAPIKAEIVVGDARLRLQDAVDGSYGLIILDAFSSDAVPVHLITRQAVDLYLSKLANGGMLAFHISNRHLDLKQVVGDLAKSANLTCLNNNDAELSAAQIDNGKLPSEWVVMARRAEDLGNLARDPHWRAVNGRVERNIWTDDFSNIMSVFRWK